MVCFSGYEACRILAPWLGSKPVPPALEDEVLDAGPPGRSPADWVLKGPGEMGCHEGSIVSVVPSEVHFFMHCGNFFFVI